MDGRLNEPNFDQALLSLADLAEAWLNTNQLQGYMGSDSLAFGRSGAVFQLMTDTIFLAPAVPFSYPFRYDTEDFFGGADWTKMFVTKLLRTGTGNCHSIPLLYKLLCDQLGAPAYLALAPNHLYIKQHSKSLGWYNTELTSASFPLDSWLMASGYISADALRAGTWMDTLSAEQSIALCMVDLAHGYRRKHPELDDDFAERCAATVLAKDPDFVPALLLQVDVLKDRYLHNHNAGVLTRLNTLAGALVKLDYRDIPQDVYLSWLADLSEHREQYTNPALNNVLTR